MQSDRVRFRAVVGGVLALVVAGGALLVNHSTAKEPGGGAGSPVAAGAASATGTAFPSASGLDTPPSAASTSASASASGGGSAPASATTPKQSQPTTAAHTARPSKPASSGGGSGLDDPAKKEIAMELVSSAENSSLNWRAQYSYIQDIGDGRGYTAGIIGFCSGTGDMLQVVQHFVQLEPGNILAKYIPALKGDNGSDSHSGLDPNFTKDWKTAAKDPLFQQSQNWERDGEYFDPAVSQAKADGLGTLGQFVYYDAMVMHGQGSDPLSFGGIRSAAMRKARTPAQGGDETAYLNAFLDARRAVMKSQPDWSDTSRIDTEQRLFLQAGNLNLNTPLHWSTYGDPYTIS